MLSYYFALVVFSLYKEIKEEQFGVQQTVMVEGGQQTIPAEDSKQAYEKADLPPAYTQN